MVKEFTDLHRKGEILEANCKEYEEYASDKEEREVVGNTAMQIGAFLKTVSVKQSEAVDVKVKRLQVLNKDFEIALNKEVMK